MSRSYRINVRFDPEKPDEADLLDHLRGMQKEKRCSFSRLIVMILKDYLSRSDQFPFTLEDIRTVIREELDSIALMPSASPALFSQEDVLLSEEEQQENDRSVLEDLEMFG